MMNKIQDLINEFTNRKILVYTVLFFTACILCIFNLQVSPFYHKMPMNGDIFVYVDVGKILNTGAVIYKDIWETKGPIFLLMYACLMKLPFDELFIVFLYETVIAVIVAFLFYKASSLYTDDNRLRFITAFLAVVFHYTDYILIDSDCGQTEELAVLLLLIVYYYLLKGIKKDVRLKVFDTLFIGFIVGIVFLCKYTNLIPIIPIGCCYIYKYKKESKYLISRLLLGFAGICIVAFIVSVYLLSVGAFDDFLYSYFIKNIFSYGESFSMIRAMQKCSWYIMYMLGPVIMCIYSGKKNPENWCFLISIILMAIIKSPYPHYYVVCDFYLISVTSNFVMNVKDNKVLKKSEKILVWAIIIAYLCVMEHNSVAAVLRVDDGIQYVVADIIKQEEDRSSYVFIPMGSCLYYLTDTLPQTKGTAYSPGCIGDKEAGEVIDLINNHKVNFVIAYVTDMSDHEAMHEEYPELDSLDMSGYQKITTMYNEQCDYHIYIFKRK